MLTDRPVAPLSPPTSPRMSDSSAKATEYNWQQTSYHTTNADVPRGDVTHGLPTVGQNQYQISDQARPGLRSYKSFPYSLGPSSRLPHNASVVAAEQPSATDYDDRLMTQGPQPTGTSDLAPATYGGSAPTSPAGRLTPRSGGHAQGDEQIDEQIDDEDIDLVDGGEDDGEEKPPMTAAELRAHKRKMKRFRHVLLDQERRAWLTDDRLTHNQTRFLMSEFARQAHPDAAHRERLSREIPGLSPRQVQVWFQNRRAKLKRLTTDDRERMLRSRALPESFDMTQALHSPFGTAPPTMGTPMPSPSAYSHFGNDAGGGVRPLTLDTLRRVPDYEQFGQNPYTSPSGITPAMGQFAFTPPQSATETISPGSAASDMSSFGFQPRPPQESPRRPPFAGSMGGGPPGYGSHPSQMPRLHMHERFNRPMGETASSPLRTSMSYSALGSGAMSQNPPTERAASFSEHTSHPDRSSQHRSLTNPTSSGSGPYGLGFTYSGSMPSYQNSEQTQTQPPPSNTISHAVGFQGYRRDSHLPGPPPSSYPSYQPPAFAAPQMPQYSNYNPQYPQPPAFPQSYQPQHSQRQSQPQHRAQASYAALPSQSQNFVSLGGSSEGQSQEGNDDANGGVPVPPSSY